MLHNGIQFGGDSLATEKITVRNVTAGATVAGGVYALDLFQADADTSGAADPIRAALQNIVPVSADNIGGIIVVTPKIIAPGESGEAVIRGLLKVRVDGALAALKTRLAAQAGQDYLAAASVAIGNSDVGVGVSLATKGAGTALVQCLFDGVSFQAVINPAVS